jgi:hypothetical protein
LDNEDEEFKIGALGTGTLIFESKVMLEESYLNAIIATAVKLHFGKSLCEILTIQVLCCSKRTAVN